MRPSEITVSPADVMQKMVFKVRVTGMRRFRICTWIAVRLISLAGIMLGKRADIEVDLRRAE